MISDGIDESSMLTHGRIVDAEQGSLVILFKPDVKMISSKMGGACQLHIGVINATSKNDVQP